MLHQSQQRMYLMLFVQHMQWHHTTRNVLFDAIYAILPFRALCCYLCFFLPDIAPSLNHNIPGSILAWILNYLTDRSQYVRITSKRTLSHCLQSNTGAPQGTVLAPFLFTLYTSDCRSSEPSCPLIKFADDTAMIGLIKDNDDTIYQQQLAMFVKHCDANFLELNVSKTKEMIIDFRISCSPPSSIVLKGSKVDRVSSYKYLGIMIDDKLAWHDHIDYLIKRLNVRMYCFRKLNYFHVDKRILALFYESVIASVWRYCLLCWGGNVSQGGRDKINRIVNKAGRMISEPRQNLEDAYADLLITKLTNVMDDASHPLHDRLAGQLISRSGRLPWLADIFPPLFHRQSEFTMLTFRGAQFPLICNLFFFSVLFVFLWAFIMCIISRNGAIKFYLTWLDLKFH